MQVARYLLTVFVVVSSSRSSAEDRIAVSGGITVSVTYVSDRLVVGFGLDVRAAYSVAKILDEATDTRSWSGAGLYAQCLWSGDGTRYSVGAHGGSDFGNPIGPQLDVELGWLYRETGRHIGAGHGVQIGTILSFALMAEAHLRFGVTADAFEPTFGAGLRFPGPTGFNGGGDDI